MDENLSEEAFVAGRALKIRRANLVGAADVVVDIMKLRDAVYVNEKKRLGSVNDMASSFDKYDASSWYFVAYCSDEPVGCIKVVPDSGFGLPCEDLTSLVAWKTPGRIIIEIGHLLSLPTYRNSRLGLILMRHALHFCVCHLNATHVIGDFFASENSPDGLQSLYRTLGFQPVGEPYLDTRFMGSPASIVAIMDIHKSTQKTRQATGARKRLLEQFFRDFHNFGGMNECAK